MKPSPSQFELPTVIENASGNVRTVGFELEFSGINLQHTVNTVCAALNGTVAEKTAAEVRVTSEMGDFNVEVDWDFLKRLEAHPEQINAPESWLEQLSETAALLVPIEVVSPPLAITSISDLNDLVDALQKAGAKGTEESLIAAYGVHINPEIPALDAATINRYLCAFALLQWWLVDTHDVNLARRVSPYIDLFDEAYIKQLLHQEKPSIDTLIDNYLEHNPTRNRALDMLPMFAHINAAKVRATIDDPKIKSRPTFHYRLPNCRIDDPEWSLATSWNLWCIVEKLANDESSLTELSEAFLSADRLLLGVKRSAWVETIKQWINDHE